MANFTKRAIKESFMKLLEEQPLSEISVKDIVEECGINRNSFYYHFQDIPSLVKEIITEEADLLIQKYPTVDSIDQCLEVGLEFALKNRRAVLHIYHSVSRDVFEDNLRAVCHHVVKNYFMLLLGEHQMEAEDQEVIIRLYRAECFGLIIDWMSEGMRANIMDDFHRLVELRKEVLEDAIRVAEEKKILK